MYLTIKKDEIIWFDIDGEDLDPFEQKEKEKYMEIVGTIKLILINNNHDEGLNFRHLDKSYSFTSDEIREAYQIGVLKFGSSDEAITHISPN